MPFDNQLLNCLLVEIIPGILGFVIFVISLSIVFVGSAILAFYHFGIEQGFFSETPACIAENLSENLSKEEITTQQL